MKRTLSLLVFCFISSMPLMAQGEWNNWYFGQKAGITFQNGSPPTALLNSNMVAGVAGVSVVSDSAGQLLFYTHGGGIFNRQHQIMLNSYGLHGYNVHESVVAVPLPGSSDKYYVFTNGFLTSPPSPPGYTLEYSIVDMTLDNGLGGILPAFKNVIVQGAELSSGAITAVRHHNNCHIWIIAQTTDSPKRFLSYLLTENGIQPPIVSIPQQLTTENSPDRIRVSPDGRKMICIYTNTDAEYYDFNPATGNVSSLFNFNIPGQQNIYTAEFSVDNKYIYVFSNIISSGGRITQFNAGLTTLTAFIGSGTKVADLNYWGKMRLGPDNKIYITKRRQYNLNIDSLSVLHSPGSPVPLCGYQDNYVPLLGKYGRESLPFLLQRYFAYINHTGYCQGMPVTFEPNTWPPPDSLWWNFGDPTSGTANFSNDSTPEHIFNSAGTFTVQMIVRHVDMRYDTATINITIEPQPSPNLGPDRTVCENQTVVLDAGFNPQWTYLWSTGATTSSIAVSNSGTYSVTVTSPNGCTGSDSVVLSILPGSTPLPKQIRHN